ncbi:YbaN family protein [Magnetospirillum molischianum]|uniref:Inner membrane protein ybaN n=1 Tax=Magnetospirillum molischianum DSM 120 TaxID=1150626 RepID=H8FS95_MAGML|nr:YbaN family protein [Magnetospirillum molischianum]CCG41233.1 Inner membrane protein ybaN [Magnetospirillum molischianum DSM 120]
MTDQEHEATGIKRLALLGFGWIFFGLGVLGVFLPVLPTTPFMLLALWCFARSSRRFHHWLFNHRVFGPPLQRWERHKIIPLSAKIVAVSAMSISMIYVSFFTQAPPIAVASMGVVCLIGAGYILSRPHRLPDGTRP